MTNVGMEHLHSIRVYYEDTDAGGVVYYSSYLRFAERARTEFLRDAGFDHIALMTERDLVFAVRRCEVDYFRPARLDDALQICTRSLKTTGASFWLEQLVKREGATLVGIEIQLVCLNRNSRPVRLPENLRLALNLKIS